MSSSADVSTSVLVVGGSLVGLSAAMFLAHHQVPMIVIERRGGSSLHPRAIGYTTRTIETFTSTGLASRLPPPPPGFRLRRTKAESLAGKWFDETFWSGGKKPEGDHQKPEGNSSSGDNKPEVGEKKPEGGKGGGHHHGPSVYSQFPGIAMAQDTLEPLILQRAVELGAEVRHHTELISLEQDEDGVTAKVAGPDGKHYIIRAQYLVAADGHRSPVREALGVNRTGRGHMKTVRSVLFTAPLDEYLTKGFSQFTIEQPDLNAFLTTYHDGRWVLMFSDDLERDEVTLRQQVIKAIGRDDIEVKIITTGRWELSAQIADTFQVGKVFLAGDAAHTLPPNRGGYGANTGIEDAHNIAWKLAAVISGASTPQLLDTYDAERRPIAWLRHQQIFTRQDYKDEAQHYGDGPVFDDEAMELGQLYRSTAVLGAGSELPAAKKPDEWAGQAGTRGQHLWISRGPAYDAESKISTLDLFGRDWVLLSEDPAWTAAVTGANDKLGVKVVSLRAGTDFHPADLEAFRTAFGLGTSGASLVRPDGYVAWRVSELPANPEKDLIEALGQVSSARGSSQSA